jgi:RNA polymerase sigma-70 factor (ECF subfamily)
MANQPAVLGEEHPLQQHSAIASPAADATRADLADLVARAKTGDRAAFAVLYRRHVDEVYRFALARLADGEAAEDATQTVFVRAFGALPTCRENAAFVGWLFAIARGVVTDQLRARRYRADPIADNATWPDATPGPEEIAMDGEARRILLDARERCLSERDRDLFDLLLTDLNDKQIAVALGRSHVAVRKAHSRLLSKLRACLAPVLGSDSAEPRHV